MNPNYLFQDELQYEPSIHGIISQADDQTLFKVFRSVIPDDIPVHLPNLAQALPHFGFNALWLAAFSYVKPIFLMEISPSIYVSLIYARFFKNMTRA
jgi:hypothetical protein